MSVASVLNGKIDVGETSQFGYWVARYCASMLVTVSTTSKCYSLDTVRVMTYRNLLFRSINVSIDRLRIITGYTGIENEIHRTTLIEKKNFLRNCIYPIVDLQFIAITITIVFFFFTVV